MLNFFFIAEKEEPLDPMDPAAYSDIPRFVYLFLCFFHVSSHTYGSSKPSFSCCMQNLIVVILIVHTTY